MRITRRVLVYPAVLGDVRAAQLGRVAPGVAHVVLQRGFLNLHQLVGVGEVLGLLALGQRRVVLVHELVVVVHGILHIIGRAWHHALHLIVGALLGV